MMRIPAIVQVVFSTLLLAASGASGEDVLPLPVSEVGRSEPVDFGKEIMPILKRNCLACHHAKESEGGLVLETLASIQKGGDSGPAVIAKDSAASLLMSRATGAEEPLMPPEDNDVGAVPMNPEELGLLKLWIEQGATGSDLMTPEAIKWQPIPESIRSVYAMDVSPDGQYSAIGRANRVIIVDLADNHEVTSLVDPSLKAGEVADVDLVQSIAFSPDGERIATGGFRTVRLWKKTHETDTSLASLTNAAGLLATNADQTAVAFVNAIGDVEVWDFSSETKRHVLSGQTSRVTGLVWASQANRVIVAERDGSVRVWDAATGTAIAEADTKTTIRDLDASADGSLVITNTASGKVELFRVTVESEKTSIVRAAEAVGEVADATAIRLVSQPAPLVMIAKVAGGVVMVEPNENKVIRTIDHGATVVSLALSSDHAKLATGGRDGKTRLWNVADGAAIATLESTPRNRLLLAQAERDANRQKGLLAKLNTRTGELTEALKKENEALAKVIEARDKAKVALVAEEKKHTDAVALVASTQSTLDQAMKATGDASQMLPASSKTMELATANSLAINKEIETLTKQLAEKQAALTAYDALAAKSKAEIDAANQMAVEAKATADKATKDLDAQKKAVTATEDAKKKSETELTNRQQALDAATAAVQLATDAIPKHEVIIDSETRRAGVLDAVLVTSKTLATRPSDEVLGIDFSRDAARIATVHRDGSTRVYRVADGLPLDAFEDRPTEDAGVEIIGDRICRFAINDATRVHAFKVTWELERTIGGIDSTTFADRVTALQFRRDSMTIAVGGGAPSRSGDVKIFAVDTGQLVRDYGDLHSDTVLGLDFSPDGSVLASASADRTIQLLDVATGESKRTLEGHTHHVLSVAWNSDGQTLASASADQSVKVWDTKTGEVSRTIVGFPKELTSIKYVQATTQVIVACANGQVRLSETSNGATVRNFDAAGDFLYAVSLTPDAKRILAGGQSGAVRVWNLADGALVSELK